jgi:hypothetical protein
MLPHCHAYKAGIHYASAQIDDLSATILHYLEAEEERCAIVDNAYRLLTQELTLVNSVDRVMQQAESVLQGNGAQVGSPRELGVAQRA